MQEEILVRYIALIILIVTIASVFSIVGYFLKGIALYKLAERHKIPNGAMAFFPVFNSYLLGRLSEKIKSYNKKESKLAGWLVTFATISFVLGVISVVLTIMPINDYMVTGTTANLMWLPPVFSYISGPASILVTILTRVAGYSVFRYHTNHAKVLTFFSFVPFMFPIFLFAVKNADKGNSNAK